MPNRLQFTRSLWFVAVLSLLVSLGTKVLIETLTPMTVFDWLFESQHGEPFVLVAGVTSFWREESMIRALSFGIGAIVACLFARSHSWQLAARLVAVSLLAAAFAQPPNPATALQLAVWGAAGPTAVLIVCVVFYVLNHGA